METNLSNVLSILRDFYSGKYGVMYYESKETLGQIIIDLEGCHDCLLKGGLNTPESKEVLIIRISRALVLVDGLKDEMGIRQMPLVPLND